MNASSSISPMLNAVLAFFFPEVCQLCGEERAGAADGFVCAPCRSEVRFIEPPFCNRCGLSFEGDITEPFECANCRDMELHFCSARSAVAARGTLLEIIHRYKYGRALWFEPFLVNLLLRQAVPELQMERWDCIVPVPLHAARKRDREFNQAERLAKRLGAATGISVNTNLLKRVLPTRTQTQLSREDRAANMRRAFAILPSRRLNGERIVLVDDVFTTGATTSACARVLKAAGAGEVCVWTVARGL